MKAALIVVAVVVFVALLGNGPMWMVEIGAGLGSASIGLLGTVFGILVAIVVGVVGLAIGGIAALVAGPVAIIVTLLALAFAAIVVAVLLLAGLAPILLPLALVLAVVWLLARRPASERSTLALPPPR